MTYSREEQERAVAEIRRLRDAAAEARAICGHDEPADTEVPGVGHPAVVATGALLLFAVIGFAFTVRSVLEMVFG